MSFLRRFAADESGATAIEYGLIASLIAISIIAGASALGSQLSGSFNDIKTKVRSS